jgi:hypothetical protein
MRLKIFSIFTIIALLFIVSSLKVLAADITKPTMSNIRAEDITLNSATIRWDTNEFSTSFVDYYMVSTTGMFPTIINAGQGDNTKSHKVVLNNLTTGKKYYFRVISNDPAGNETISAYTSFTTKSIAIPTIKINISTVILQDISPTVTPEITPEVSPTQSPVPSVTETLEEQKITLVVTQASSEANKIGQITPTNKPEEAQKTMSVGGIPITPFNMIAALIIVILVGVIVFLVVTRKKPLPIQNKIPDEEESVKEDISTEKPKM